MYKISIVITENCNLECLYCYTKKSDINMSIENFNELYNEFKINNKEKYSVDIFGGEPLQNWSLIKHITTTLKSDEYNSSIDLFSNGLLLDKERSEFIKVNNINFHFSFDGLWTEDNRKQKHGKTEISQYVKKLQYIEQLTDKCSCMIYPNNLNLIENYKFITEEFNLVPSFKIVRDNVWSNNDIDTFEKEFTKLCDYIKTTDFSKVPSVITESIKDLYKTNNKKYCMAGKTMVSWLPDKSIHACPREGHSETKVDYIYYDECKSCKWDKYCQKQCTIEINNNNGINLNICRIFDIIYSNVIKLNASLRNNIKWKTYIRQTITI